MGDCHAEGPAHCHRSRRYRRRGAAGSKWLPGAETDPSVGLLDEALTIVHKEYVVGTPATADLRPGATEEKPGSRDPEVEMAFDLVKAARILDQPSRGEVSEQAPPRFHGHLIKEGCVRQQDASRLRAAALRRTVLEFY